MIDGRASRLPRPLMRSRIVRGAGALPSAAPSFRPLCEAEAEMIVGAEPLAAVAARSLDTKDRFSSVFGGRPKAR
jgi:hypothetical protein